MEKKKPSKGVIIFGWLMIVVNAFLLLAALDIKSFFEAYKFLHQNFIIATYIYSLISAIVGIVAGIGIGLSILYVCFFTRPKVKEQFEPKKCI